MTALLAAQCALADVPQQDFASALYFGKGETGIVATLAQGQVSASAATLPCAGCHGDFAQGGGEGTAQATPLLGFEGESLKHGPDSLFNALVLGRGMRGNELNPAMPKYGISKRQAELLAEFLTTMAGRETEGVSPTYVVGFWPLLTSAAKQDISIETLEAMAASKGVDRKLWGRSLAFKEIRSANIAAVPEPFAVLGGLEWERGLEDVSGQIRFPDLVIDEAPSPRVVTLAASIDKQFAAILNDIAKRPKTKCYIFTAKDRLSSTLELRLRKTLQKANAPPCASWSSFASRPDDDVSVIVLSATSLNGIYFPGRVSIYGLLEVSLPVAAQWQKADYRVVLADPAPELTDAALRDAQPIRQKRLEAALNCLLDGVIRAGEGAGRQAIFEALPCRSFPEPKVRLLGSAH